MKNKHLKNFSFVASIILIIFSVSIATRMHRPAEAAAASTIYLSPPAVSATNGQNFTLEAKINPGTNQITAVEVHISYDVSKVRISSITPGGAFPSVLQAGQYNNSNGTASIIVGVTPSNPPKPVTSETTVATFNFNVVGQSGTSNVSFTNDTIAASIGESGNVITTRNFSQVTIGRTFNNNDFAALANDWLKEMADSPADVNSDNVVNSRDLGIMMSNWGN